MLLQTEAQRSATLHPVRDAERIVTLSSNTRADVEQAATAFREWAASCPEAGKSGEWETFYDGWMDLWTAFKNHLDASDPRTWDQGIIKVLLYVLARDNEDEELKRTLIGHPEHLLVLAKAGIGAERDAAWQLADALGFIEADGVDIAQLLQVYVASDDEYVSRRALMALGRRKAPVAERLACRAWETGHEYQRMAALGVLTDLGSPLLLSYLDLAEEDGRRYLVSYAQKLRGDRESEKHA